MAHSSMEDLLRRFKNLRVLIIGDVILDAYIHGHVQRISPEAPVPILKAEKKEQRLGGAANVALNVQALGAIPLLCSVIGDDKAGNSLCQLLEHANIHTTGIYQSPTRITSTKTRVLSDAHHMLRIDEEKDSPLEPHEEEHLRKHILSLMKDCDLIIFEDYDKGTLRPALIDTVIQAAHQRPQKLPIAVDPKKKNFFAYPHTSLFKPNLHEFKEAMQIHEEAFSLESLHEHAQQLQAKLQVDMLMITLSQKGIYASSHNEHIHRPAHVRHVADVSGAGDAVASIAALAIAAKLPLSVTVELANLAGGLVCERPGIHPITYETLCQHAKDHPLLYPFLEKNA